MVVSDEDKGDVVEFSVGATATVNGFITRAAFIDPDGEGQVKPFDASPLLDLNGRIQFDMKVTEAPDVTWMFKVESAEGDTAAEMPITNSSEGVAPTIGEWQTYTFPLQVLADAGLELGNIDVVMIFPAWGEGEGSVYQITNLVIEGDLDNADQVIIFEDSENADWPLWTSDNGIAPTVVTDDEEHGSVTEFSVGGNPAVNGFNTRLAEVDGEVTPSTPFDATSFLSTGVVQFDMKVTTMPSNAEAAWYFKIESDAGATNAELPLTSSVEGVMPTADQWQTYTFNLSDLADAGLDVSTIDIVMVFPAWGQGDGAIYHVDNVKIFNTSLLTVFDNAINEEWPLWASEGGDTPTVVDGDEGHNKVASFTIGDNAEVVLGFKTADGENFDASSYQESAVIKFDMKLVTAPSNTEGGWKFKVESEAASSFAELDLSASKEGIAPVVGEWQTYTFSLADLATAGLDTSAIDVMMIFPGWGTGTGAEYHIDNVAIVAE